MSVDNYLVGDTVKLTWSNSGATVSDIYGELIDGAETVVTSATLTSSGNGFYYGFFTLPDTPGFYRLRSTATIGGYPFKRQTIVKAILGEVD